MKGHCGDSVALTERVFVVCGLDVDEEEEEEVVLPCNPWDPHPQSPSECQRGTER